MTNGYPNQWVDALRIDDDNYSQGSEDPSYFYGGSVYTLWDEFTETEVPGHIPGDGVRPAYFTITRSVRTNLKINFGTFGGGADIRASVMYRHPDGFWMAVDYRYDPEVNPSFDINVEPDLDYYFVVRFKDEATAQVDASYTWYAELTPSSAPVGPIVVPAIPISVDFSTDAEPVPGVLTIPPIQLRFRLFTPDTWNGRVVLSAPEADAVVAASRPRFMVGVDPDDDIETSYTVEIQYAATADLADPSTMTADASVADGGVVVTPTEDLAGTIYWRARVKAPGMPPAPWTAVQSFTVDLSASATTIPITWTVSASATRPIHLWHFFPPGPDVGDTVTIYGQGFPATGTVYFGGQDLTTTGWKRVGATSGGTIQGPTVNPEHYEITFVAPSYDGDGELLTVTADTGEIGI